MASELENWSLEKWLKKLSLRKYKQAFIDNGYDTADLCANLGKEDLDAIGVHNKTSRSTLFTQSKKLLELFQKEGLMASEEVVVVVPKRESPRLSPRPSPTEAKKRNSKDSAALGQSPVNTVAVGATQPLPDYSEPWNSNSAPSVLTSSGNNGGGSAGVPPLSLPDYSEPWNSNNATGQPTTSPTSKAPKTSLSAAIDAADGPVRSPVHVVSRKLSGGGQAATTPNSTPRRKVPVSPGAELPPFKKSGSSGLTRLQLKLKIREELFTRGVVLTEYPYCREVRLKKYWRIFRGYSIGVSCRGGEAPPPPEKNIFECKCSILICKNASKCR